jgi:solute carrier family 25, member 44
VAERKEGAQRPTVTTVAKQLLAEDGPRGFFRGLLPRMANVVLWGTCMVNAYEFLKRFCVLPEPPAPALAQS